jgi:hypothetical protein
MSVAPDADLPAQRLARMLLGGPLGLELLQRLSDEFGDIRREEAFAGVALAWTDYAAALVAAETEIRALRRQLEQRRAA